MTTYNLEGMLLYETYDIVETAPGRFDWQQNGGEVFQTGYSFITSLNSESLSYTITETDPTELTVNLTGLGMPYAIDVPSLPEYVTLTDIDYSSSEIITISWNGGANSSTILTINWEWEDMTEMTAESLTMVINLTGDDFPAFANYAAFEAFLSTATMEGTAPPGYQEGDDIALTSISDYVDKVQDDLIAGEYRNDDLRGGIGDDTIIGAGGDDVISGSFGFDTLYGGLGNDTINGGNRADVIYGGEGLDVLNGGNGHDTIYGGNGADTVQMGTGNDVFIDNNETGPAGNDVVWGGDGNDIFNGGGGDDLFIGMTGNDKLIGGVGNDTLRGGADNDRLFGGQGHDDLYAGSGSDTLTGGVGDDFFIFTSIDASDANVIRDFELGTDEIEIENYDPNTTTLQVVGGDTLITLDSGATILVEGVTDTTALEADIYLF
ncbi:MAG: calcium-binding protein [Rhodobacteraceae bacterium]|nr:calcium-binding protein [Paracoccaceae bacterium]